MTVATNKYHRFLPTLVASASEHFFPDDLVTIHVFADQDPDVAFERHTLSLTHHPIPSWGFPQATLYRYRFMVEYERSLLNEDLLWYCDADMQFVAPVADEIVPTEREGIALVRHPGFWQGGGSWETNPSSCAYLPPHMRRAYYAGGFWGGRRDAVLALARDLDHDVAVDEMNGVMAVWHDESHLNRYATVRSPKVLPPSYVYPESWDLPFPRILLALDKDHGEVRS